MHKYFRAIGFSNINNRNDLNRIIDDVINGGCSSLITHESKNKILADYSKLYADGIGITLCGEWDDKYSEFYFEYAYPFVEGVELSSSEKSLIDRHSDKLSYAGVCDDGRSEISIIYYLRDRMDFLRYSTHQEPEEMNKVLYLSALSVSGTILLPINKNVYSPENLTRIGNKKREELIDAARNGDEEAMETLTLDDIDLYNAVSRKAKTQDVYTLVESTFMPYGIECDQYSILGEITDLKEIENSFTKEKIYKMIINYNGIPITLCINKEDLYGEPEIGRRFKGTIWLQGKLEIY